MGQLKRELEREIFHYKLPVPGVDDLAHIIYNEDGKMYRADVTVEELKVRISLRKLLKTMDENQIELLEIYLEAKESVRRVDEETGEL